MRLVVRHIQLAVSARRSYVAFRQTISSYNLPLVHSICDLKRFTIANAGRKRSRRVVYPRSHSGYWRSVSSAEPFTPDTQIQPEARSAWRTLLSVLEILQSKHVINAETERCVLNISPRLVPQPRIKLQYASPPRQALSQVSCDSYNVIGPMHCQDKIAISHSVICRGWIPSV